MIEKEQIVKFITRAFDTKIEMQVRNVQRLELWT